MKIILGRDSEATFGQVFEVWCLVEIMKMKFDQDLCATCDMNSILGSVVPLAMFN